MKLWQVAEPVAGSTHTLKYSLFYGVGGRRLVCYDNERGKGDHRHVGDQEERYLFTAPDRYRRVHDDVAILARSGLLERERGGVRTKVDRIEAVIELAE